MANLISPGYNRSTLISQMLAPVEERCLEFKGLNKRKVVEEGEMSDMKNLTSDEYPVLAPRKPRGEMELPEGVVLPLRIMARYEKIALIARDENDQINFYFDGELYHTESYWFTADENGNKEPYPAPFDKPFHIEADVSIGGSGTANPVRMTSFDEESQTWIDYIRLYRKDEYDENVSVPDYEKHFKEPDSTGNYISNTVKDWKFELACAGEALCDTDGKFFKIDIINSGDAEYSVQLDQSHLPLIKGERYRVSFEAMATEKRKMRVAVTAPNVHWCRYLEDTNAELNTDWQTHCFPFEMTSPDDDNGRLEFNLGNSSSDATVCIKNIRFEKMRKCEDLRRTIAVVGSWDDAENFNLFVESLMKPEILKDYVITAYTFGLDDKSAAEPDIGKDFVEFIDKFNMAAMFVFAEMLKTREIIEDLRDICLKKSIPVVFLEHQYDGVVNAILNYASGFEKVVKHILDDHGCKNHKAGNLFCCHVSASFLLIS